MIRKFNGFFLSLMQKNHFDVQDSQKYFNGGYSHHPASLFQPFDTVST